MKLMSVVNFAFCFSCSLYIVDWRIAYRNLGDSSIRVLPVARLSNLGILDAFEEGK